jgi:hypothetical protein
VFKPVQFGYVHIAKHQEHLLKTDSAERNLNLQILLTKEEHFKFQNTARHAVALIHPMTIYLHFGIAQNVLNLLGHHTTSKVT